MLCGSAMSFDEWVAVAEAEPTEPGRKMQFCTADKLEATLGDTTWLWPHWVPYGYVTIVGGEPGCGKSMLLVSLLRTFLHSGQWPDGAPAGDAATAAGHRVLWVETDDSQALLKGRLRQMGVDTSRVILPGADGTERADLTKPDVVEQIGQHAAEQGCGLIVVDTLAGAHGLDENSATMRSLMSGLAALARSGSLAVVCCHHLRKQGKDEAAAPTMDRLRGSSTISASARSIIGLQPSRKGGAGGEKSVQMEVIKSNLCLAPPPLTFRLSDDGPVFVSGDEGPAQSTKITLTQRAEALLREKLGLGPWPCKQLLEAAQQEGIGSHALYNAAKRVGVVKVAMGRSSVWELPRGGNPETAGEGGETGRGSNESGAAKGSPGPAPG